MAELKQYRVTIGKTKTTVQLTELEAKRYYPNAEPVEPAKPKRTRKATK